MSFQKFQEWLYWNLFSTELVKYFDKLFFTSKKSINDPGVKVASAFCKDNRFCSIMRHCAFVNSPAYQSIVDISECDNSCAQWNILTLEMVWIPGAIKFSMLIKRSLCTHPQI